MAFARKLAVAVDLNEPMPEIFSGMKSLGIMKDCDVYFVTVNLTAKYAIGLGESAIVYPLEADQRKIREETLKALQEFAVNVLPAEFNGKFFLECLFSDDPKSKFCQYVKEENIDTVIVSAREKRGFFESSFTHYVNKHSRANIIILKHLI